MRDRESAANDAHAGRNTRAEDDGGLRVWVPTAVVILTLIGSMAIPAVVLERVAALQTHVANVAEPAREDISSLLVTMSIESAEFRSALDEPDHVPELRALQQNERNILLRLERPARAIGPRTQSTLATVQRLVLLRQADENRALAIGAPGNHFVRSRAPVAEVAAEIELLLEEVRHYQADLRRSIAGEVRTGGISIAALVALGLLSSMFVTRLSLGYRRLSTDLRRLARNEAGARLLAEEAVRARDDVLSIVSHDLRAPLTTISLAAQMLDRGDAVDDSVRAIRSGSEAMLRLVNDLLDTARLESGRLTLRKRAVDANDLLASVARNFKPLAEQKRLHLACVTEQDLPRLDADADRLMQVFANLVTNAIKFTPEHGEILIRAAAEESSVRFVVSDTGPGIPPASLNDVFRKHWQAKKTAHLGAGLGLTIAKGVVEAHGGTIAVANAPGGGAAFSFTVPRAQAAAPLSDPQAPRGSSK